MALFGNKKNKQQKLSQAPPPQPRKNPDYKNQNKKTNVNGIIAGIAVIVIIIAALYAYFVLQVNQTVISSPETVNITKTGALYSINSNQYYISLAQITASGTTAYIHINRLPIFLNPLLNITLSVGNITKINVGSNYSNMGLQLTGIAPDSVMVQISPIATSLEIAPDTSKISAIQSNLYGSVSSSSGGASTTIAYTTTISSSGGDGATTSASTTTVPATNTTNVYVQTALKENDVYGIMQNLSVLYANTINCGSTAYNTSYIRYYGYAPQGPNTFINISVFTPYNVSIRKTNTGKGNFNFTYFVLTPGPLFNNTASLIIIVNASKEEVTNTVFKGAYLDLGYSNLQVSLNKAKSIGGACGIEVP